MNVRDIVNEHGVLSGQYAIAVLAFKTKQTKYPKIIHFNALRARIFVSTGLEAPQSYRPVLVDWKEGNISVLNKGKAMERLSAALKEEDLFKVVDDAGQPKNGVNDKLINSFVEKVFSIIDKVGIHVKRGVAHAKERVSTGRSEPDPQMEWVPYEQLVAIAMLKHNLVQQCLEQASDAPCKTQESFVLQEAIMAKVKTKLSTMRSRICVTKWPRLGPRAREPYARTVRETCARGGGARGLRARLQALTHIPALH